MKNTPLLIFILPLLFIAKPLHAVETCSSVAALESSVSALSSSIDGGFTLTSKLSDDIGLMADRIGVMADRIVTTENLLAATLVTLTGSSSTAPTVLLTAPLDEASVAITPSPTITFTPTSTRYLLFASTDPLFPTANTVSLFITSTTTLDSAWSLIANTIAGGSSGSVYIAVRSVDSNDLQSDISNSIKLNIQ